MTKRQTIFRSTWLIHPDGTVEHSHEIGAAREETPAIEAKEEAVEIEAPTKELAQTETADDALFDIVKTLLGYDARKE